jgi:RNA polymerase sigma-70 factor (ECF subfamily)
MKIIQPEYSPAMWKACWEYMVAGRPAAQVAAESAMTKNSLYLAKSRMLRRLREVLEGLLD